MRCCQYTLQGLINSPSEEGDWEGAGKGRNRLNSSRKAAKMQDLEKLVEFTGQVMEEKCILKKPRE